MSRKRKKTGGNPAKAQGRMPWLDTTPQSELINMVLDVADRAESVLTARLIQAGASVEDVLLHGEIVRCKAAVEVLGFDPDRLTEEDWDKSFQQVAFDALTDHLEAEDSLAAVVKVLSVGLPDPNEPEEGTDEH